MSPNVANDLQALTDFRNHLVRFNRILADEYQSLLVDWKGLGAAWRDRKYTEFGDALDEVGHGIQRYLHVTDEHETHLRRMIEATQRYLDVR